MSTICHMKSGQWWLSKKIKNPRGGFRYIYPKSIKVGDIEKGRIYVPERTCEVVKEKYDEEWGFFTLELTCGDEVIGSLKNIPNYCPDCGCRIIKE